MINFHQQNTAGCSQRLISQTRNPHIFVKGLILIWDYVQSVHRFHRCLVTQKICESYLIQWVHCFVIDILRGGGGERDACLEYSLRHTDTVLFYVCWCTCLLCKIFAKCTIIILSKKARGSQSNEPIELRYLHDIVLMK